MRSGSRVGGVGPPSPGPSANGGAGPLFGESDNPRCQVGRGCLLEKKYRGLENGGEAGVFSFFGGGFWPNETGLVLGRSAAPRGRPFVAFSFLGAICPRGILRASRSKPGPLVKSGHLPIPHGTLTKNWGRSPVRKGAPSPFSGGLGCRCGNGFGAPCRHHRGPPGVSLCLGSPDVSEQVPKGPQADR